MESILPLFKKAAGAAFWAAGTLAWPLPVREINGPLDCLRACYKRVACASAIAITVPPLLAPVMLPSAEEYFETQGIDPEIIDRLTDRDVYVRESNIAGIAHMLLSYPLTFSLPLSIMKLMPSYANFAERGFPGSVLWSNISYVNIGPPGTARQWVSEMAGIPQDSIEHTALENFQAFTWTLFHETRHTASENHSEHDADLYSSKESALFWESDVMIREAVYTRTINGALEWLPVLGESHETGLFLDATFRNVAAPSSEQASVAADNVQMRANSYLPEKDGRPFFARRADSYRSLLAEEGDNLSGLEFRYASLYIEAAEYYAPSLSGVRSGMPDRAFTDYTLPAP